MKRYALLAATVVVGGAVAFQGSVNLQATTPGSPQTGHSNITGTSRAGSMVGYSNTPTGIAFGGDFRTVSTSGRGVLGNASATSGVTYGGLFQSFSTTGRGIAGIAVATSGFSVGGFFTTNSPDGKGVQGSSNAVTGLNYGVYGRNLSPAGYGVYSDGNMAATGIISGNGSGLTSVNADQIDGLDSTAFLQSVPSPLNLTSASNFYTIRGENTAVDGTALYGKAGAATGYGAGGLFESFGTDGRAVVALAQASTGQTSGVYVQNHSSSGRGIYGWSTSATGTAYGVYGQANLAADGFAVFANGDMGASGVKPFRIDHPSDPENKYLLHYAAESPMPQNFYVGNVVTDSQGFASVDLPDYFDEINRNFKYQLTVVGKTFAQAVVWEKIKDNRFQIRTSEGGIEVSWEVKADRNDLYVRRKQPKDVVNKQGFEKGTYQQPDLYGFGPERGMNYEARRMKKIIGPKK